jgi:hypothetical protein
MQTEWQSVLQRILTAWWDFPYTDGLMTVQEIEAAQERLQIKLPSTLIHWYGLVGNRTENS